MSAQEAINMRSKVRALQSTLFRAAKQSPDRRFGALYDKIYREDVLWVAWERVRANDGAPGVDRQSFDEIEKEIGVEVFLKEIAEKLRAQRYRPLPVRRCWIDKPGKPEKRPLGIPVIRDRVIQMATKIVIEPIFEANFLPCSYGFRPKRSAHKAIRKVRSSITFKRQTTVIDADIKGYFDNIRHDILDDLIQRRISDPRVLKLIRGWLRAGVLDDGEWIEPNGAGTPQGGVISPLLANIYLHSFDKMFEMSRIPGTLVRYADDFVVLVRDNGEQTLERIRRMLSRLGLVLHPTKTRMVRAEEGFDFLGVHFRLCRVRKRNARLKQSCRLWPSDRSIGRIKQRTKEEIGRRFGETLEEVIARLNPVLRGWSNYHTAVQPETKRLLRLNYYVRERLRIFLKRKYSDQSRGQWRVLDNLFARLGLFQFGRALYLTRHGC
jgi:group II intron reverse transcriptase/maturase